MINISKINDVDGINRTFKQYVKKRIGILKDLCIWDKLSMDEKSAFYDCKCDLQIDRLMGEFRRKYL